MSKVDAEVAKSVVTMGNETIEPIVTIRTLDSSEEAPLWFRRYTIWLKDEQHNTLKYPCSPSWTVKELMSDFGAEFMKCVVTMGNKTIQANVAIQTLDSSEKAHSNMLEMLLSTLKFYTFLEHFAAFPTDQN